MYDHLPTWHGLSSLAAIVLLCPGLAGCSLLWSSPPPEDVQSLLKAVETAPESVGLEIFQVRIPESDRPLYEELWQAVDEQRFDVEVRHQLVDNGFRVGVLGGILPDGLARQLTLQSDMPANSSEQIITERSANPSVVRRVLQLNKHEHATIQASDVVDQRHIFLSGASGFQGRSYQQAQAIYSLRAEAIVGQQITLQLTPELHHGEMRNRYAGSEQGIFMVTPSREREIYNELNLRTDLVPGELLVVSCLPDIPGSLGHFLHAQDRTGPTVHKLVLVRLLQVPPSEILADAN